MLKKASFTILALFFFPIFFVHGAGEVKILLVPGHDNEAWGAQYGSLKEADMNLAVASKIYDLLEEDNRFEVYITRDDSGYTEEFADYFSFGREPILAFIENARKEIERRIENGDFVRKKATVRHNRATEDAVLRLYGINKWANENAIDAVIHVHFNDYPRKNKWVNGIYKGFAIYVPVEGVANSEESADLARSIWAELKTRYATSTYEKEKDGFVYDPSLIALSSNDTLLPSVRSVLIEYGYIYRFGDSAMRHRAYADMANLTVRGIAGYFFEEQS